MTWIQTYSAQAINFEDVEGGRAPGLRLRDIAHALAHICRYTGHVSTHYSVAEHSVLVSRLVLRWAARSGVEARQLPRWAAAALLHDAAEAYVGDVSRPLKQMLRKRTDAYDRLEEAFELAIAKQFVRPPEGCQELIGRADMVMLRLERDALLPGEPPQMWHVDELDIGDASEVAQVQGWIGGLAERHFIEACIDYGLGPHLEVDDAR